jgi:hypothetical protein
MAVQIAADKDAREIQQALLCVIGKVGEREGGQECPPRYFSR